jgi:hypothetical protein
MEVVWKQIRDTRYAVSNTGEINGVVKGKAWTNY